MGAQNELLDAIQILIDKSMADRSTRITGGAVKSASGGLATVTINGYDYSIPYSGTAPTVGSTVRVFIPNGNMSDAFIGGGGSGGGSTGTTNYNNLTNKPSINGTTLSGNKTSTEIGVYGTGNPPPYPVTSVAGKTGDVTLTKSNVGLGNVDNVKQYSANNPPPYPVTSVNGKTGAVTVPSVNVPSTTSLIKGDGSGGLVAATAGTDYALLPTTRKVTLTVTGWNSSTKQQTVTCSGVLSDATKQLLIPTPVNTAAGNPYDEASIQMVAQGANSVTFYADTVPTESIDVYVAILPINYLG